MQGAISWELIVEYRFSLSRFSFFLGLNDVFPSLKRVLLLSHVKSLLTCILEDVGEQYDCFIYLFSGEQLNLT